MVEAVWLVTKRTASRGGRELKDKMHACIINKDDGLSASAVISAAEQKARDAGFAVEAPYFDDAVVVSDLAGGPLQDDGDAYFFHNEFQTKVEGP